MEIENNEKICKSCKYFEVDESIDPNEHFGFCSNGLGIIDTDNIITISDYCSKWEAQDEEQINLI